MAPIAPIKPVITANNVGSIIISVTWGEDFGGWFSGRLPATRTNVWEQLLGDLDKIRGLTEEVRKMS